MQLCETARVKCFASRRRCPNKARWNISQSEPLSSFLGINIHYDRAKGILTFDVQVEDKIKALFEEREWLSGIGVRSVPMMSDTDVRKTLDIKPKERLEQNP